MHTEIKIDDSVLMLGNSSKKFPPNKLLTHIYVPNVDKVFQKAIELGCEPLEKPKEGKTTPVEGDVVILQKMCGRLEHN